MKKYLNQKGVSVAESVLAVGLMALGVLGFYKVNSIMDNQSQSSAVMSELSNLTNHFYTSLNSGKACKRSFLGLRKGAIGAEVFDSFELQDSMGNPIISQSPLEVADRTMYPTLNILSKSVVQADENHVLVMYEIENPEGAPHRLITKVEVAYDSNDDFVFCINNETRTNVALCESVKGDYDPVTEKCNFFNLNTGNYSAQQCEGLGGEVIYDEPTNTRYCNKATNWYRSEVKTTYNSRKKVDYRVDNIVVESGIMLPTGYTTNGADRHLFVIGVTAIERNVAGGNIEEWIETKAYKSPTAPHPITEPSYAYDAQTGSFNPPAGYATSDYYSSPRTKYVVTDANLEKVHNEYRLEKMHANTLVRTRVEYVRELPDNIKDAIRVAQAGGGGPYQDQPNVNCTDPISGVTVECQDVVEPDGNSTGGTGGTGSTGPDCSLAENQQLPECSVSPDGSLGGSTGGSTGETGGSSDPDCSLTVNQILPECQAVVTGDTTNPDDSPLGGGIDCNDPANANDDVCMGDPVDCRDPINMELPECNVNDPQTGGVTDPSPEPNDGSVDCSMVFNHNHPDCMEGGGSMGDGSGNNGSLDCSDPANLDPNCPESSVDCSKPENVDHPNCNTVDCRKKENHNKPECTVGSSTILQFDFWKLIIDEAYAGPTHHLQNANTAPIMLQNVYNNFEDKPIRHLNGYDPNTAAVPSAYYSINPDASLPASSYYKIIYKDIITEEKFERTQTVYY